MVFVMGHRGCRYSAHKEKYPDAPYENSLKALEFSLVHSMGLETDVILSTQKTPYLTHDTLFSDQVYYELKKHLDPASQHVVAERFIYQINDDEIANFHFVDGQSFTRLDMFFKIVAHYPDRIINLELKGPHTQDVAVYAVEQAIKAGYITADQIVFSSFNLPALRDLRTKTGNRFKIGALFATKDQSREKMYPDWPDAPQDAYYTPFKLDDGVLENDEIKAIAPDFFNLEYKTLSHDVIDAIQTTHPQARIILWALGEPEGAMPAWPAHVPDIIERYAASGKIFAAITDFPDKLQTELEKRGLAAPLAE